MERDARVVFVLESKPSSVFRENIYGLSARFLIDMAVFLLVHGLLGEEVRGRKGSFHTLHPPTVFVKSFKSSFENG